MALAPIKSIVDDYLMDIDALNRSVDDGIAANVMFFKVLTQKRIFPSKSALASAIQQTHKTKELQASMLAVSIRTILRKVRLAAKNTSTGVRTNPYMWTLIEANKSPIAHPSKTKPNVVSRNSFFSLYGLSTTGPSQEISYSQASADTISSEDAEPAATMMGSSSSSSTGLFTVSNSLSNETCLNKGSLI